MKAWVRDRYGGPEVLSLSELPEPTPGPGEVRVRVAASSLNASDWEMLTGAPAYVRIWGIRRPRHRVLGSDVAGVVDAVGPGVADLRVGDAVFGDLFEHWGGLAELACAPAARWVRKPPMLSFRDAAALPQAACLALQGLRGPRPSGRPRHVAINGAGGGAGSFAVQMAKHDGDLVTAVDSAAKAELMRQLGADEVVDYTSDDFTDRSEAYDLILDFVAAHPMAHHRRALRADGVYRMVGGTVPRLLAALVVGALYTATTRATMGVLGAETHYGIDEVLALVAGGAVRPMIGDVVPFSEAPRGLGILGAGRARGKVVVDGLETSGPGSG